MARHDLYYNKLAFNLLVGVLLLLCVATVVLADNLNHAAWVGGSTSFVHGLVHAISNLIARVEAIGLALAL